MKTLVMQLHAWPRSGGAKAVPWGTHWRSCNSRHVRAHACMEQVPCNSAGFRWHKTYPQKYGKFDNSVTPEIDPFLAVNRGTSYKDVTAQHEKVALRVGACLPCRRLHTQPAHPCHSRGRRGAPPHAPTPRRCHHQPRSRSRTRTPPLHPSSLS